MLRRIRLGMDAQCQPSSRTGHVRASHGRRSLRVRTAGPGGVAIPDSYGGVCRDVLRSRGSAWELLRKQGSRLRSGGDDVLDSPWHRRDHEEYRASEFGGMRGLVYLFAAGSGGRPWRVAAIFVVSFFSGHRICSCVVLKEAWPLCNNNRNLCIGIYLV